MELQTETFKEPRGIIRILQFIFSIVAFATTSSFTTDLIGKSVIAPNGITHRTINYPFILNNYVLCSQWTLNLNVSSDCQFFVATGVLSLLYCILIMIVYILKDEMYQTKKELPIADFVITVVLAVFWLSGSAAWANGTSQLKSVTDVNSIAKHCPDYTWVIGSFGKLNSSLIVGFLNFFLWTSNLWFIYKETIWFKPTSTTASSA